MQLTKKQSNKWKEEILKCKENFNYFANKYCKISQMDSKTGLMKIKPLKLYDYQVRAVEAFENNKYVIFKKPRQMGITVLVGVYCLWIALFNEYQTIVIVSENQPKSQDFIDKIQVVYDHLHPIIKGKLITDNKGSLEFDTHSKIVARPCKESVGRSDTPTLFVMDEAAFMSRKTVGHDNLAEDVFTGAEPALNLGGKAILISTPNGTGNFYAKTYTKAKDGNSDFYAFEVNWWERPEYCENLRKTEESKNYPCGWTSDWLEKKIKNSTNFRKDIMQETFANFLGSGKTILKIEQINSIFDIKPCIDSLFEGKLKAWESPDERCVYCAGVDTSEGLVDSDTSDNNCVQIFNCTLGKQAAEYVSKVPNEIFVRHVEKIVKIYNNAYTNIENNSVGYATVTGLKNKDLNLYKHKKKIGTSMTGRTTRPLLITLYKQLPRLGFKFFSESFRDEMYTFIDKNGRADHESGCHDDRIMAALLALMVRDRAFMVSPLDPLISGNHLATTSDIRRNIEKLETLLVKEENKTENDANNNYMKALSYGMTPEYIETFNLLIGNNTGRS